MGVKKLYEGLDDRSINRVIEMAWEDRTPFDAIEEQFGLSEANVIKLMRREMKESSFRMWRARVQERKTKHTKKRSFTEGSHKCSRQRPVSYTHLTLPTILLV